MGVSLSIRDAKTSQQQRRRHTYPQQENVARNALDGHDEEALSVVHGGGHELIFKGLDHLNQLWVLIAKVMPRQDTGVVVGDKGLVAFKEVNVVHEDVRKSAGGTPGGNSGI